MYSVRMSPIRTSCQDFLMCCCWGSIFKSTTFFLAAKVCLLRKSSVFIVSDLRRSHWGPIPTETSKIADGSSTIPDRWLCVSIGEQRPWASPPPQSQHCIFQPSRWISVPILLLTTGVVWVGCTDLCRVAVRIIYSSAYIFWWFEKRIRAKKKTNHPFLPICRDRSSGWSMSCRL